MDLRSEAFRSELQECVPLECGLDCAPTSVPTFPCRARGRSAREMTILSFYIVLEKGVKHGAITLSKKECQEIFGDKESSDLHMNALQNLLKKFSHNTGLQNTLLQMKHL